MVDQKGGFFYTAKEFDRPFDKRVDIDKIDKAKEFDRPFGQEGRTLTDKA